MDSDRNNRNDAYNRSSMNGRSDTYNRNSRNSRSDTYGINNKNSENNKKNADRTAVAIEYVPGETAPKILATGKGAVADRIIEKAKESNVPTYKDDKLADTLSRLKIGDMIPPELYEVVAEILVFVNDVDKLKAKIDSV